MYKRKEIIIIITIIIITIFLAFLPKIIDSNKKKEEEIVISDSNQIEIKIVGEIKVEELNISFPKGVSYSYIIKKIELYLNEYSVISSNLNERYYENTTIYIESSDIKEEYEDTNIGKININLATFNELISLYGIGEARANKIIEYRKNKKIETFEELKKVIGVSNEIIERIKEKAFL